MSGELGRVAGVDFAVGLETSGDTSKSFVSQISHSTSDGWLRNVQAGQATEVVGVEEDNETAELVGREMERCFDEVDCAAEGRTTPQSIQTCVFEGLQPDTFLFLFPQTSHSQLIGLVPLWSP